jgi:hypothetical protein
MGDETDISDAMVQAVEQNLILQSRPSEFLRPYSGERQAPKDLRNWDRAIRNRRELKVTQSAEHASEAGAVRPSRPIRVFLCHSSGDKPAVRALYWRLREVGVEPWLDEKDLVAGQEWQQEIPKAVRASDVVLVCLSHSSTTKAGYVQKEIRQALDAAEEQPEGSIFIIPVLLETLTNDEVPQRLRPYHWVNYFDEKGFAKLRRALRKRAEQLELK